MPWFHSYDPKTNTIFVMAYGVLTDEELVAGAEDLRRDPDDRADARRFGDYSAVDEFRVSARTAKALFSTERIGRLRGRHALLAFGPSGVSDFETHIRTVLGDRMRIFCRRSEALAWLNEGVPAEQAITEQSSWWLLQHRRKLV